MAGRAGLLEVRFGRVEVVLCVSMHAVVAQPCVYDLVNLRITPTVGIMQLIISPDESITSSFGFREAKVRDFSLLSGFLQAVSSSLGARASTDRRPVQGSCATLGLAGLR